VVWYCDPNLSEGPGRIAAPVQLQRGGLLSQRAVYILIEMQSHTRRRSGLGSANTSMTDVRRAVTASDPAAKSSNKSSRPAPMTRRSNTKVSQKLGKSPRDRALEWEEERWWEEERETFPQYW
jgi:hypothetical protein